jgi:hypothetical protein
MLFVVLIVGKFFSIDRMSINGKDHHLKETCIYTCIHFLFTTFCLLGRAVSVNFTGVLTKSMFCFFVVTICFILFYYIKFTSS